MEQLPPLGKSIGDIVKPTLGVYAPLLNKNAETIQSVPKETHSYGPTERQQLDIYTPPKPSIVNGRKAVLVFIYGGGFVNGQKTLPGYLAHANIASFFALKYGYTVVVPDYRLVNTHSDAKFPSGGEDLALVVDWIASNVGPEPKDLFMMGNSAGGVHLSTFLLHSSFAATRAKISSSKETQLRGVVLLSVPFHFHHAHPDRAEILTSYYGTSDAHQELCPAGLLSTARKNGPIDFLEDGVRVLVLNGDLDPDDEILIPRDDFLKEWSMVDSPKGRSALAVDFMTGHNHISPFCSLGTGIDKEEAWGVQVAVFCETLRKFQA